MRFTIDASVFISRLSETEQAHEASRGFLQALAGKPVMVIVPTLVSPEISGAMRRLTRSGAVARDSLRLLDLLPNLNLIAVDEQLAVEAAGIAAEGGMRGADAVYVAVAQRFDAVLVSLDRLQREGSPPSVKALTPDDALRELGAIA